MSYNPFKTAIEKVKFRFVPVIDLRDDTVYGYKVIKDFNEAGYESRDDIYDLANAEGVLEFFLLKIQAKAYETAIAEGYGNSKIFHTLRINYIADAEYYYSSIENLITKFELKKENMIYELKGASEWKNLDQFLKYMDEDSVLMFKQSKKFPLNKNMIFFLEPDFIEAMSIEAAKELKNTDYVSSKIILKIPSGETYSNEQLLEAGVDYAYQL